MSGDAGGWLEAVRDGVARAGRPAGAFAQYVSVRATTGSTNDDVARAALEGAPEGYTVIAAEQSSGRGRRGADWHSPLAHGVYLSTLLRPDRWRALRADAASAAASLVTLMAGVAVVSAVHDVCGAAPVELKWPNDVMVRAASPSVHAGMAGPPWRKLAGILAEGASDHGVLRSVVLGIGVNVCTADAPPAVAARMIALDALVSPGPAEAAALVPPLVAGLLVRLREGVDLLAGGAVGEVRARWRGHAPSVAGTAVRWRDHGQTRDGHADGIDAHGALQVRLADGQATTVHGGDVEWLFDVGHP